MRVRLENALNEIALGRAGRCRVEEHKLRRAYWVLRRQRQHGYTKQREGGFVALADDEQVAAALRLECGFRGAFD